MAQAPYMPVFTDALLGDTSHLNSEQFGSYCRILFATWRNNGVPFADDDKTLACICHMTVKRWRDRIRGTLVNFFDLSDGCWRQKRLEKEWDYVAKKCAKRRAAGNASAQAKRLKNQDTASTHVGTHGVTTQLHTLEEDSGSSTESYEEREESAKTAQAPFVAAHPPPGYAFEGRVIRLTRADLARWERTYYAIPDIDAELHALDDFYADMPADERQRWFIRCSKALNKAHQRLLSNQPQGRANGQGTPSPGFALMEGFCEAGREWDARQRNCGTDCPPAPALLDGERYAGNA